MPATVLPLRQDGAVPAQREKAVSYAAERAATKQRQNIRLLLGFSMLIAIGGVLTTAAQFVVHMEQGLTVAASAAFTLGVCLVLTTDYDVNEYFLRHRLLYRFLICQFAVVTAVVLAGWFLGPTPARTEVWGTPAGELALMPYYLWLLWRENDIREQRRGFPLATELVGAHFALMCGGLLVHCVVLAAAGRTSGDLGTPHSMITIGVLVLGVWLLVWISLARSHWGVVGGARRQRWLAMAADTATPTQRAFMCAGVGRALWVSVVSVRKMLPPAGEARSITVPVLHILLLVLPMIATWMNRDVIQKALERRLKLGDGSFIASLLVVPPPRVGDEWWVKGRRWDGASLRPPGTLPQYKGDDLIGWKRRPSEYGWYKGCVQALHESSSDKVVVFLVVVQQASDLPSCVPRKTSIARSYAAGRTTSGYSRRVLQRQARASLFRTSLQDVLDVLLAEENEERTVLAAEEGAAAATALPASPIDWFNITQGDNDARRTPCDPGAIDWFVSHSWRDDPTAKRAALTRCADRFVSANGRAPTVWIDKICVQRAFRDESFCCLPIYLHACRGVLVLCGPTYFTRLWCVWELYILFAFSDALPRLSISILGVADGEEEDEGDDPADRSNPVLFSPAGEEDTTGGWAEPMAATAAATAATVAVVQPTAAATAGAFAFPAFVEPPVLQQGQQGLIVFVLVDPTGLLPPDDEIVVQPGRRGLELSHMESGELALLWPWEGVRELRSETAANPTDMDILTVVSSVVPCGAATEGAVTFRFECDDGEHLVSDLREAQRKHTMAVASAASATAASAAAAAAAAAQGAAATMAEEVEAGARELREVRGAVHRARAMVAGLGLGRVRASLADEAGLHPAAARLVTRLRRFSLADAHCFDPNEERQLRAAIEAMPGGGEAFQATIRRLGARFDDLVHNPAPGSAAGEANTAHGMTNQTSADFSLKDERISPLPSPSLSSPFRGLD